MNSEAAMGGAGDIMFIISEPSGRIHPHTAIFCVDFALYYSPKGTAKLQWVGRRSKYDNIQYESCTTLSRIFSKTGISLYNINFAEMNSVAQ